MKLAPIFNFVFLLFLLFGCNEHQTKVNSSTSSSSPIIKELFKNFKNPPKEYYPETWFHLNGNNISKEGLKRDLQAIKNAGLQGIHLFNKSAKPFPNVKPVKILSPEWERMIAFTANECKRLGLKFTMQNCPGWSMTGGPWVPVNEAQREVVETTYYISGGKTFNQVLELDSIYRAKDFDYKDIQVLAFPTLKGDTLKPHNPFKIETNNLLVPWKDIFNPNSKLLVTRKTTRLDKPLKAYRKLGISKVKEKETWVKTTFKKAITLRTLVLPQIRHIVVGTQYPRIKTSIKVEALINNKLQEITTLKIPDANWNDRRKNLTLSIPETKAKTFKFTFKGAHAIAPESIRLTAKPRLHNHEAKAAKVLRRLHKDVQYNYADSTIIKQESIINLTEKLSPKGQLKWVVPNGDWTIIRFGHVNMRLTNKPAVAEATGWESSKLDKIAIENHLRKGMIGNLIKDGGAIGKGKLHGLLIDSWESHVPTWTINSQDMFKEFKSRRGYSMKKYLPATLGYVVNDAKTTSKFLRDLRHTMDEVFIDNFFKHFATVAHDMGAEVYTEGAGGEVLPIDPMRYYGVSDIPMTEFWYPKAPSAQNEYAKPIYNAASAAHLYNKKKLAAEACTQVGVKWNEHPFSVKSLIDYNFAKGVNHLVFHTFSHTPQTNVYPGSSFGGNIGFPLVREQTWWKYMPNWVEYLSRNQYVLQQGEYVADVLRYYGDHYERPPFDLYNFPKGYRFDYLNSEILQEKISVKNGNIHVENGGDYRVITLRDSDEMLLSTLEKIKELVLQGAIVLGDKPKDSPSLMNNENDLEALKKISNELWDATKSGSKQTGKGRVYWGKTLAQVLQEENIKEDVIVPDDLNISWIHRKTKDADIYFVASKEKQPIDVSLSFRVSQKVPQMWDAFTGNKQKAKVWKAENGRTNVVVSLPESGSAIIVFTKGSDNAYASKITNAGTTILDTQIGWYKIHTSTNAPQITWLKDELLASIAGTYTIHQFKNQHEKIINLKNTSLQDNWKLTFNKGWDTPETIDVKKLKSLTKLKNTAIQHYSGTITYTKKVKIDALDKATVLDLGEVANIAEVWCNNKKIGVKWAPPFLFNLTKELKKGENNLTIKVTNTWRNQLIFDNSRSQSSKKTWTTAKPKKHETTLEKSGLIGPVLLKEYD